MRACRCGEKTKMTWRWTKKRTGRTSRRGCWNRQRSASKVTWRNWRSSECLGRICNTKIICKGFAPQFKFKNHSQPTSRLKLLQSRNEFARAPHPLKEVGKWHRRASSFCLRRSLSWSYSRVEQLTVKWRIRWSSHIDKIRMSLTWRIGPTCATQITRPMSQTKSSNPKRTKAIKKILSQIKKLLSMSSMLKARQLPKWTRHWSSEAFEWTAWTKTKKMWNGASTMPSMSSLLLEF